jgi:hypothetical protein
MLKRKVIKVFIAQLSDMNFLVDFSNFLLLLSTYQLTDFI